MAKLFIFCLFFRRLRLWVHHRFFRFSQCQLQALRLKKKEEKKNLSWQQKQSEGNRPVVLKMQGGRPPGGIRTK